MNVYRPIRLLDACPDKTIVLVDSEGPENGHEWRYGPDTRHPWPAGDYCQNGRVVSQAFATYTMFTRGSYVDILKERVSLDPSMLLDEGI